MYLTDMECLSLIPSTCGSGNYCQEVSQMLHSADVFDTKFREVLEANARNLDYRLSGFKDERPGHHVSFGFTVKLQIGPGNRAMCPTLRFQLC